MVIYLFFVETSGRTLEEVAALFDGVEATHQIELAGAQAHPKDFAEGTEGDAVEDKAVEATAKTHVLTV